MKNPFTPNFGQVPEKIAGRDLLISEITNAFDNAPGDPALNTILIGSRGIGKTMLLSYFSDYAKGNGWIAVNVSCRNDMLDTIYEQALKEASHLLKNREKSSISGFAVKGNFGHLGGGLDIKYAESKDSSKSWRMKMTELLEELNGQDVGLLITIDEVQPKIDDIITFASDYQFFVREERKIAVIMAGLSKNVSDLFKDKSVSFLRRSYQQELGLLEDYEVSDAFRKTIESAGKTITDEALSQAVSAIGGFPYMIQLVGYRTWNAAENKEIIEIEDVQYGVEMALKDFETRVLSPCVNDASNVGIQFLLAMLEDNGSSSLGDISERMNKKRNYVGNYKKKLVELGLVEDNGDGTVRFALPNLKEYLKKKYQ